MQIFRYLRPVLVVPVVLAGLAIIPSSASPDAPARGASADPAPVQLLDLTTRSGRATEIARSGLDGARSSGVAVRVDAGADGGPAGAPGAVGALTAAAGDVGPETGAPETGAGDVDPERDAVILTAPLQVDDFLIAGFTWTGGADAVQASVVGDAAALPADLTLALVPDSPSGERDLGVADVRTAEAGPTGAAVVAAVQPDQRDDRGSAGAPAGAGAARPPSAVPAAETDDPSALVTTREEWGANPAYLNWRPNYAPADHVIVHHTAGTNDYTPEQSPSIVRGIYYYHAVILGWGDIGYNFLVDKYGQVFEGRYGTLDSEPGAMVVGGHAYGANTGTMGISMMGNYSSVSPSEIQVERVGQMAGWFLGRAGVADAYGSSRYTFHATQKYRRGQSIDLDVISAHRDVGYTACPGDAGYSMMDWIRSAAQEQIDGAAW